MHQVILFKPEDRLIDFLSMQLSLEDLSIFINMGSYEFMSLVRIAYIVKHKVSATVSQRGGEEVHLPPSFIENAMTEYSHTFEDKLESLKKNPLAAVQQVIKKMQPNKSRKKGDKKADKKKKGKQTKQKRK